VQLAQPISLTLALESRCTLEGHIDAGRSERGVEIPLSLFEQGQGGALVSSTTASESGDFEFRWLPAGEYQLELRTPGYEVWSSEVELLAGERAVLDVSLEPLLSAGVVKGLITSASGSYDGQLLVFLLDEGNETVDVYPTSWRRTEDGDLVADFGFDSTRPGLLHLDVLSLADAVTFRSEVASFEAPFERARITLLDELPTCDWSFEVVDAVTGLTLEEFALVARVDGGAARRFSGKLGPRERASQGQRWQWTLEAGGLRWNQFESHAPLRHLPVDAQLSWTVSAEGFSDVNGDSSAFDVQGPASCNAIVRMQPK
jgi:hypothetical protein